MDKPKNTNPEHGTLFELQDFLESEVKDASPGAFYRSFVPLTDGLGLESPKHPTPSFEQRITPIEIESPTIPPPPKRMDVNALFDDVALIPKHEPTPKAGLASVIEEIQVLPPPLPTPTAMRRFFATLVDQLFVWTLFAIAIVITSNMSSGFASGFSTALIQDFLKPELLRFAVMEYAAVWVCYFTICAGLLNMTFGMWVWGIRISFGEKTDPNYWMCRMMRVVWSVVFFAPVAPLLLLAFRRKSRNLLDVLSGSNLYLAD